MSTFVKIITPKGKITCGLGTLYFKDQLIESLSFIHPMKIMKSDEESIDIILYDVHTKDKLDSKLDYLAEASSVDFSYQYKFIY